MSTRAATVAALATTVALSVPATATAATWSTSGGFPVRQVGLGSAALAAGPDGRFAAVWTTFTDVRFSLGSLRGALRRARVVPGSRAKGGVSLDRPALAMGRGGRAAFAWRSSAEVRVALVHGSRISPPRAAGGADTLAGVVLESNGRAAVAFGRNGAAYLSVSTPSGHFAPPEVVADRGTSEGIYLRSGKPVVVYVAGTSLLERTRLGPRRFSAPRQVASIGTGSAFALATAPDGTETGIWDDGAYFRAAARDAGRPMRTIPLAQHPRQGISRGAVAAAPGGSGLAAWSGGVLGVASRSHGRPFGDLVAAPGVASEDSNSLVAGVGPSGWGVLAWAAASPARSGQSTGVEAVLAGPHGKLGGVAKLGGGSFLLAAAASRAAAVVAWLDRSGLHFSHARLPRR